MKLKLSLRCIAALLTIAILTTTLPLVLVAEGLAPKDELRNLGELTEKEEAAPPSLIDPYEEISLREGNVKHFRLEDGSYVAVQYPSLVHEQDEEGNWVDINNHLSLHGGEYTNQDAKIKLVKKITGNGSIFTIHDGKQKIELSLLGAIKKTEGVAINTKTEFDETATTLQKMMTLDNLSTRVVYADILEGVDLEYAIDGLHIKENLYIKEKGDTYSYTFVLKLNNLTAYMAEDGSVHISDPDTDEDVYVIPLGYMFDADGAESSAVTYNLTDQGNGSYHLTVTPDANWVNAEGRAFPVCVDPPLLSVEASSYEGTHISTASPNTNYVSNGSLWVGYQTIGFTKVTLPTLPGDAYIYDALYSAECKTIMGAPPIISVRKITSDWSSGTLTYALHQAGAGAYQDLTSDIQLMPIGTEWATREWNITSYVKDWYNDPTSNYGIAFVAKQFGSSTASYAGIRHTHSSVALTVRYYRLSGIESYWSYSQASAGLAGTGYVNLATGGLSFAIDTLACTDSLFGYMPTLVYNPYLAGTYYTSATANTAYTSPSVGYGFQLSTDQSIVLGSDMDGDATTMDCYIWLDGDGTEHPFVAVKKDGIITHYEDTDGMQCKLVVTSTGYEITDPSNNILCFSFVGNNAANISARLSYIADQTGNKLIFRRNLSNKVTSIELRPLYQLNGIPLLNFTYNAHGLLSSISYPGTTTKIIFKYANPDNPTIGQANYGFLRELEYMWFDGSTARCQYQYTEAGTLEWAQDIKQGFALHYSYLGNRVTSVQKYHQTPLNAGQKLAFLYKVNATEVRASGSDDTFGNSDDIITTYVFDSEGRATSVYSTDVNRTTFLGGTSGTYSEQASAKNSLEATFTFGGVSPNYLHNGGFEKTQSSITAPFESWDTSAGVWALATDALSGKCVQLLLFANARRYLSQDVYLTPGEYVFSVDVENANIPNTSMQLSATSLTNSSVAFSKEISINEATIVDGRYTPALAFVVDSAGMYQIKIQVDCASTLAQQWFVYFDNAVLVRGGGASQFNMVEYGNFDNYSSSSNLSTDVLSAWGIESGVVEATQAGQSSLFGKVLCLNSTISSAGQIVYKVESEEITTSQLKDAPIYNISFSGMAKGDGQLLNNTSSFNLELNVTYLEPSQSVANGYTERTESYTIEFVKDSTEWQYGFSCITTEALFISQISISCVYENQAQNGYFDRICVNMAPEKSLRQTEYNEDGTIKSSQNGRFVTYYMYDESGKVTTVFNSDCEIWYYEYDEFDLLSSITQGKFTCQRHEDLCIKNGLYCEYGQFDAEKKTIYSRDYFGLSTGVVTAYGSIGRNGYFEPNEDQGRLHTQYAYDTNSTSKTFGALIEETNTNGQTTRYFYHDDYGWLLAVIEPDNTGTSYEYDGAGNLIGVYTAGYFGEEIGIARAEAANRAEYTYDDNMRLTSIETDSVVYAIQYNTIGQVASLHVGGNEIVSQEYFPNNGKLKSIHYANGATEEYVYNDKEQLAAIQYTNGNETITAFTYLYNENGTLNRFEDNVNGDVYLYEYDQNGRVSSFLRYEQDGAVNTFYMTTAYDSDEQLADYSYSAQTQLMAIPIEYSLANHFDYDEEGILRSHQIEANSGMLTSTYGYEEDFNRLCEHILSIYCGSDSDHLDFSITKEYTYLVRDTNDLYATSFVSAYTLTVRDGSGSVQSTNTFVFTYDANGNITKIVDSAGKETRYEYDNLGQLTREDNPYTNHTYLYTYDYSGNLTQRGTYNYTSAAFKPMLNGTIVTYEYNSDNGWGDQLTSFGGVGIEYDANGNPVEYYNGFNFTWVNGTELATATKGTNVLSFSYDDNGVRVRKTVNGVDHLYTVNGSQILAEEWDNDLLVYLYDANGAPIGMEYRNSTYAPGAYDLFVFETNMFGDITGIYDADGNRLISYTYDAWGNCQTTLHTQNLSGSDYYAQKNPFRYRGYYYDTELGLYYLNARYYDPNTGRFISADSISFLGADGSLIGYNLYAYCDNNPVMYTDPSGHLILSAILAAAVTILSSTVIGATIGAISGALSYSIQHTNGDFSWQEFWGSVAGGAVDGAITGAVSGVVMVTGGTATGVFIAYTVAGAFGGGIGQIVDNAVSGHKLGEGFISAVIFGALGGAMLGGVTGKVEGILKFNKQLINPFTTTPTKAMTKHFNGLLKSTIRGLPADIASGFLQDGLGNIATGLMKISIQTFGKMLKNF